MSGYVLEFRDEYQHEELIEKMKKAKKAVCDAMDALEEAENGSEYSERNYGSYRGGGRYRGGRGMSMRDEEDYEPMEMHQRSGRGRYM